MFGRIDHIGVAVEDIDEAVTLYRDRLGMREQHRETVEEQGVDAVLLEIGEGHVELISPLGADTRWASSSERNGPGLHHVAYQTDDIDSRLEELREAGPAADRRAAAHRHPRQPRGVRAPEVHGRRAHRDRRAGGGPLMADRPNRVDIGFQGGQSLAVRVADEPLKGLRDALADEGADRWHELKTEDSDVSLDLSQIVYVRVETEEHRVGF